MAVLTSTLRLSLIDNVSGRAKLINSSINSIRSSQSALLGTFGRIAALGGAYLGVTQGIAATAGAAMDFESAFADVRKVVDATDEQFENMRRTIRNMSNELPIASTDIAALFAAAGESGVATTDLKAFSEMAARVGIAFDLSAGQAGESLAKLKTQLGLTVPETGDLADAINHLSNNMASKAKDVTDYMLRVGALAEMGGFAKEEIAAIGSAMIAAGAQSETAGTAMQNVVKALTRGKFAKKEQKDAARALGLDLPTIAKMMVKDAPKALKTVLTAISKAPKEQQISILSQFFGDEAKAFAPLIGNIGLLDQALDSVSDKSKYAGSAFREYVERSNTTANVLQVLRNRFVNLGSSIGDSMLPSIKEAALGVGHVLDTLGERASIFDKMGTAIQGFTNGLGMTGGIREVIEGLGDMLFGKADGSGAADQLGRVFANFQSWGKSIRELRDDLAENPIVKFFADMAPYGFQIMAWTVGIGALAKTVLALARAMAMLSGVTTIVAALKTVGAIADVASGGTFPKGNSGNNQGANVPPNAAAGFAGIVTWFKGLGIAAAPGLMAESLTATPGGSFEEQVANQQKYREGLEKLFGVNKPAAPTLPGVYSTMAQDNANRARTAGFGGSTENLPGKTADDISINASSIAAMTRPSGIQQVLVTNPQAPNVTVHAPITITGVGDGTAAGTAAANQLGSAVKTAVEGGYSDGAQ